MGVVGVQYVSVVAAPWIVDDQLWELIAPLMPVKPAGTPGPARMDDRLVLQGILFVLFTGIGWEDLPQELGFGSGMTCWRRLRDWQSVGMFDAIHQTLLDRCHAARLVDFSRVIADGSHLRAKKGAQIPVPHRSTAARPGRSITC